MGGRERKGKNSNNKKSQLTNQPKPTPWERENKKPNQTKKNNTRAHTKNPNITSKHKSGKKIKQNQTITVNHPRLAVIQKKKYTELNLPFEYSIKSYHISLNSSGPKKNGNVFVSSRLVESNFLF